MVTTCASSQQRLRYAASACSWSVRPVRCQSRRRSSGHLLAASGTCWDALSRRPARFFASEAAGHRPAAGQAVIVCACTRSSPCLRVIARPMSKVSERLYAASFARSRSPPTRPHHDRHAEGGGYPALACARVRARGSGGVRDRAAYAGMHRCQRRQRGSCASASSTLRSVAAAMSSGGTHVGNATSTVRWAPEAVCCSSIAASRSTGKRSATRTSAGQIRRWTSVTLPSIRRVATTSPDARTRLRTAKISWPDAWPHQLPRIGSPAICSARFGTGPRADCNTTARTPAESPQSPDAPRRARRRSPGEQDSTCRASTPLCRVGTPRETFSVAPAAFRELRRVSQPFGPGRSSSPHGRPGDGRQRSRSLTCETSRVSIVRDSRGKPARVRCGGYAPSAMS